MSQLLLRLPVDHNINKSNIAFILPGFTR